MDVVIRYRQNSGLTVRIARIARNCFGTVSHEYGIIIRFSLLQAYYAQGNIDLNCTHKQMVDIMEGSKEDSIIDNLFTRLGIELHFSLQR